MTNYVSARTVARELGRQLPGIGIRKLHKLLYFAQGHHLADVGEPLFPDEIQAWDHGPVVVALWREDKHGLPSTDFDDLPLDESARNTIGYVVARYGHMTGQDLEDLSHRQAPWDTVDQQRALTGEQRISPELIAGYFRANQRPTDQAGEYEDDYEPDGGQILSWLEHAPQRLDDDLHADDLDSLHRLAQR